VKANATIQGVASPVIVSNQHYDASSQILVRKTKLMNKQLSHQQIDSIKKQGLTFNDPSWISFLPFLSFSMMRDDRLQMLFHHLMEEECCYHSLGLKGELLI